MKKFKKLVKDWWFTVVVLISALTIVIYGFVMNFVDEELFAKGAYLAGYLTAGLILIIIGIANQPRKENKDGKDC